MLSIILYLVIPIFVWASFRKGFYDGILYGLVHKKAGRKIGAVKFQPYLYATQAKCRGWGLIGSPGIIFLLALFLVYTSGEAINQAKKDIANIYVIYFIGYSMITSYLFFGYRWIKEGYIDGIKNKKTKTYYHLQNGEKYFLQNTHEKERTISKHKYFRGTKAVKTGIARVFLGSAYVFIALLLFLDRDYFIGNAEKSMYPNLFKYIKPIYQENKKEREEEKKQLHIKQEIEREQKKEKEFKKDFEANQFQKEFQSTKW